jgi:hypothetical protein
LLKLSSITRKRQELAAERKAAHRKEGIDLSDVYNMDETGFRIGVIAGRIVITHLLTKAVYWAGLDNRESLTAVETVCADGATIPLMLILKGDVLLEKYFENETLLATSPSGYSNEGLAMKYLIHFYNNTYKTTKGKWRILVFDGHGSHVSEPFLRYCWQHRIVPFQLPPHNIHLIQGHMAIMGLCPQRVLSGLVNLEYSFSKSARSHDPLRSQDSHGSQEPASILLTPYHLMHPSGYQMAREIIGLLALLKSPH